SAFLCWVGVRFVRLADLRERAFERCRRERAGEHVGGAVCVPGERAPEGRREFVRTDSTDGDAGLVVEETVAGRRRGGLALDQGDAVDAFAVADEHSAVAKLDARP